VRADIERGWVGWLDSGAWRRLARSDAGRRLLGSRAFRRMDLARRHAVSSIRAARDTELATAVRTCCLFLGTTKSGGTLIGAMLDAHPRAVIADEADPLRYLEHGFRRDQIFHLLAKTAHREALKGRVTARRLEPYALAIPGHHQGVADRPLVIGDSRAGPTTRRLGDDLDLVARWRALLGDVDDRYIHVVRNPFDPIAAMVRRGHRTFTNAIDDYAAQCARVARLREHLTEARVLTVRYDNLIAHPSGQLSLICSFLGLDATEGYLADCASLIDPARMPERHTVAWPSEAIAAVESLTEAVPFLQGYAYAD
jgi:hypothetical protein